MKEKRFFPEKGLLMLSGAAFLLLIVPAWVPGFVWCGVAAVLLCAAVWRLPVSRQRVRALLSNPVHMALSLAFNGALAVNFYHNWVDSQKMQRVAGVLGMENGPDTVIGSAGTRLSGGQAQRLALARTLAHPRPLLILDDPFSALDRNTEDTVFANLQAYARDKVVFLISHRLYHFPQLRQVIFMEDGKTAVGTHAELMASVPAYRQLYESQTGGQRHEESI